jgi:TPR repeat protein
VQTVKIETIVTAIIFFSVGFLAGFIYKSQRQVSVPAAAVATAGTSVPDAGLAAGAGAMGGGAGGNIDPSTGLPNGHPPLEVAQVIENLTQRAKQNPKDPQVPLELANYLYDKHYFNLAINWYQRALTLSPQDINARTDLGTSYFYTGQPQQALAEYDKALKQNPNHQPTLFNLIVVSLEGTHDLRAATKYWNELNRQNPNYPGLRDIKTKLDAAMTSAGSAVKP